MKDCPECEASRLRSKLMDAKGEASRLRAKLAAAEKERDAALARVATLAAMLERLQFSHGPGGLIKKPDGKCPVCLGWDSSPNGLGETRMRHTKDCALASLLKGVK